MAIIIGLILCMGPVHGQRLLGGEKGIQVAGSIPAGAMDAMGKNFGFQCAVTANTQSGNYWRFGMEYRRKTFDYKQWELPYEFYGGTIGYFLQALSNHRKNLLAYTGISGLAGYEAFNKDTALLQDGARLRNISGFVYGLKGTLSLEAYLTNRWVLFAFSELDYLPKSELSGWQSQLGVGTRLVIN